MTPQPSPAAQPPAGTQLPADHAPENGAAFRRSPASQIGHAAGQAIAAILKPVFEALPAQFRDALGANAEVCGKCAFERAKWDRVHGEEMTFARLRACEAAGIEPGDPRAPGLDLAPFLAPELHPGAPGGQGMPVPYLRATSVGGTALCHPHIQAAEAEQAAIDATAAPAAQPAEPQQPGLLLARPGADVHAIAKAARVNAPGVPGYASP
jgi:hypothetical protein